MCTTGKSSIVSEIHIDDPAEDGSWIIVEDQVPGLGSVICMKDGIFIKQIESSCQVSVCSTGKMELMKVISKKWNGWAEVIDWPGLEREARKIIGCVNDFAVGWDVGSSICYERNSENIFTAYR